MMMSAAARARKSVICGTCYHQDQQHADGGMRRILTKAAKLKKTNLRPAYYVKTRWGPLVCFVHRFSRENRMIRKLSVRASSRTFTIFALSTSPYYLRGCTNA